MEAAPFSCPPHLDQLAVNTLAKGRYIIMSGRPCQVEEVQKILKYSKEAKQSLAYRYIRAKDILTSESLQQVYHASFQIECFEATFRSARLLEIKDDGHVVVQTQGQKQQELVLPRQSNPELCAQILGYHKQGQKQNIKILRALGLEILLETSIAI